MPTGNTYFEQIAVETVKRIVQEVPQSNAFDNGSEVVLENNPVDVRDRWRDIAQRVQEEQDPNKMIELVQQLISAFDKQQRSGTPTSTAKCRSGFRPPSGRPGQ